MLSGNDLSETEGSRENWFLDAALKHGESTASPRGGKGDVHLSGIGILLFRYKWNFVIQEEKDSYGKQVVYHEVTHTCTHTHNTEQVVSVFR